MYRRKPTDCRQQLPSLSDGELVERFRRGDNDAVGAIFDRYQHVIYTIARSAKHDAEWTEDTVCEITHHVLKSMASFRGDSSFGTWLRQVARHVCVNELRKTYRHQKHMVLAEYSAISNEDPAELVAERQLHEKALEGLNQLPEKSRTALTLRFVSGHNYKEIAQLLGVTIGTVKSRIGYGLGRLRKALQGTESEGD